MLPEVKQYNDALNNAEIQFCNVIDDTDAAYYEATREAQNAYDSEIIAAGLHSTDRYGKCEACDVQAKASDKLRAVTYGPKQIRQDTIQDAHRARDRARSDARNLLRASSDPVVKWIADNDRIMDEYREHAMFVLTMLPASLEQIREAAQVQGWCAAYWGDQRNSGFEEESIRAGLFPGAELVDRDAVRRKALCGCEDCRAGVPG